MVSNTQAKNRWYCADKPNLISLKELERIDKKESKQWLATIKVDGYRALVDFSTAKGLAWSRRGKKEGGPSLHPICEELAEAIQQFKIDNDIGLGTRLDCEWTGRRESNKDQPERLFVFGIYFWNTISFIHQSEETRWVNVAKLKYNNLVKLVDCADCDYVKLYEASKTNMSYEGIVLKDRNSKLIADPLTCKNNPLWLKCKWRAGDDGLSILD